MLFRITHSTRIKGYQINYYIVGLNKQKEGGFFFPPLPIQSNCIVELIAPGCCGCQTHQGSQKSIKQIHGLVHQWLLNMMMEMQPLAGKCLSHMKLYHRKNYFVLALFSPLSIHAQPCSGPEPKYRSYPKLVQALRVDMDILTSHHMPVLV